MNTSFNRHSCIRFNFSIFIYIISFIDSYIDMLVSYFRIVFLDYQIEKLKGDFTC